MAAPLHPALSEQDRFPEVNIENDSLNDQLNKRSYVSPCLTRLFTNEIKTGSDNNLFELSAGGGVASLAS